MTKNNKLRYDIRLGEGVTEIVCLGMQIEEVCVAKFQFSSVGYTDAISKMVSYLNQLAEQKYSDEIIISRLLKRLIWGGYKNESFFGDEVAKRIGYKDLNEFAKDIEGSTL